MINSVLKKNTDPKRSKDPLSIMADNLADKFPALGKKSKQDVLQTLHELLDGSDENARLIRTQLQIYLAKVTDVLLSQRNRPVQGEDLLSTEDAAALMRCSRPYVAMLIDSGKLVGSSLTSGGHRRVPRSVVMAWIERREKVAGKVDADYKAAAKKAGKYDVSEAQYLAHERGKKKKHGA